MKKEKRQKMCLEIIDQFEQLLEEKDISIKAKQSTTSIGATAPHGRGECALTHPDFILFLDFA